MARRFAQLGTGLWSEPSIRSHKRDAQRAYLLVYTQPELSRCGVLPFRLRRLAALAHDDTPKSLRKAMAALETTRHLIVDEDAEELLVRTYVRHDGLLAQPQVVAAMVQDYDLIESSTIRTAFLAELRRIWDLPDLPANERKGLLLAFGEHETDRYLDKIGQALAPAMDAAITAGSVAPFDPASPLGCPPPWSQGGRKAHAGARAPSPAPAPAPSPAPSPVAVAAPSGPAGPHPASGHPAQALLDEHLAHRAMSDQASTQLLRYITDSLTKADPDQVREALTEWRRRPGAKPGLLPHLIDDVIDATAAQALADDPTQDPDIQAWIAAEEAKRAAIREAAGA
jgi:hypothetical protein